MNNNSFKEIVQESKYKYLSILNGNLKKDIGQVFTPPSIAEFMADLLLLKNEPLYILDPGCGLGILTAAICDRIINSNKSFNIAFDLYENDKTIIEYLKQRFSHNTIERVISV